MLILVIGNPVDGIIFIGPFDDGEEAVEYAEVHHKNDEWWMAPIDTPKEG